MPKMTREFATDVANPNNTLTVFACQFTENGEWNYDKGYYPLPTDLVNLNTLAIKITDYTGISGNSYPIKSDINKYLDHASITDVLTIGYKVNGSSEFKIALRFPLKTLEDQITSYTYTYIYLDMSSLCVQCKFKFEDETRHIIITRHYHANEDSDSSDGTRYDLIDQSELSRRIEDLVSPVYTNPIPVGYPLSISEIEDALVPLTDSSSPVTYQSNPFDYHNIGNHTVWLQGKDVNLPVDAGPTTFKSTGDRYLIEVEGDGSSGHPYDLKSINFNSYFSAFRRRVVDSSDSYIKEVEAGLDIWLCPSPYESQVVDIDSVDYKPWAAKIDLEVYNQATGRLQVITINAGHVVGLDSLNQPSSSIVVYGSGSQYVVATYILAVRTQDGKTQKALRINVKGSRIRVKGIYTYNFSNYELNEGAYTLMGSVPFIEDGEGGLAIEALRNLGLSSFSNSLIEPTRDYRRFIRSPGGSNQFADINGNGLYKTNAVFSLELITNAVSMSALMSQFKSGDQTIDINSLQLGGMNCIVYPSANRVVDLTIDINVSKIEFRGIPGHAPINVYVLDGQSYREFIVRNCKLTLYLNNGQYSSHAIENYISPLYMVTNGSNNLYVPNFTNDWIRITGYNGNAWMKILNCTASYDQAYGGYGGKLTLGFDNGATGILIFDPVLYPLTSPDSPTTVDNKVKHLRCLNCYEFSTVETLTAYQMKVTIS